LNADKLDKLTFLKKNHLILKSIGHTASPKTITNISTPRDTSWINENDKELLDNTSNSVVEEHDDELNFDDDSFF